MAAPALNTGILFIRQLVQDQNSTFQASVDADITTVVNEKYMSWYKFVERRVQYVTAVTLTSSSTPVNTSDAGFIYPEIESMFISGLSQLPDQPLPRMKWGDLWSLVQHDVDENGGLSSGLPEFYAAAKLHGSSEKWSILVWPCGSGVLLKAHVRVYPTALSGSAVPELGDAEGYWLYRIAAADVAQYIGRPELVEGILAPIPDDIRGKMGVERKRDDPKRRVETSVLG
jgi:hypothetical protein